MEFAEFLPLLMFAALAILLFSGYPVAFVLGGVGLTFGFLGIAFDEFVFVQFRSIPSRALGSRCFGAATSKTAPTPIAPSFSA